MTQAAKFFDPVLGIDIHMVVIPPSPAPVPMPHPFIGVVFDPIGAALGAAVSFVLGGGGFVLINSLPIANTGTNVLGVPHIPMGASFHACDIPGNDGALVTGSKTVAMGGCSMGRLGSLVTTCNFPINLPTSICLAVPMGNPVLVGGPDSFDPLAAVFQGIRTKWVSGKLHKLLKAKPGSRRSKFICFLTGHPVDVMTGAVLTDATDFQLPGPLPLKFERNYYSRDPQAGALGQGWSHSLEAALREEESHILVQFEDGRQVAHPPLGPGQSVWEPTERYTFTRTSERDYSLAYTDGRTLDFSRVAGAAWTCPLARIRDRNDNAITLVYDAGRLSGATDSADRKLRFVHDSSGRLLGVRYHRGGAQGKWVELVRYTYDERGQLAAAHDPKGRPFSYAYRGGVLVRETNRNGQSFHFEYDWDHPDGWCVRTWGDGGLYARTLTYDKHRHVTLVDDSRGGRTHYFGNAAGLVDRVLDPEGGEWRHEWHPELLRKTAEIDPLGHRRTWEYDARGNVLCATDPLGQQTRWRYNDLDLPVETIDASGHTWRRDYDARGNLVRSVDPLGATCEYRYDRRGGLLEAHDPSHRSIRLAVDESGQVVAATDREGHTTRYAHDDLGRMILHVGALGGETRLHWDDCGQLVAVERPDRSRVSLDYDAEGNLVRRVDGLGHVWTYEYGGLNKLHCQTDPLGGRIRYFYDSEENLVKLTNEHDEPYTFDYDRRGNVVREVGFDGRTHIYHYDRAGRCNTIINGRKQTTRITRDPLGRLVHQIGSDGVWSRFAYDAVGNLVEATNEHCVVRFERDPCGRILREHANDHVVESTYDSRGDRIRRTTSLGHEALYDYDGNCNLIRLRVPKPIAELPHPEVPYFGERECWAIEIARDAEGNESARRLPGGVESLWERDSVGRPTKHQIVPRPAGASPAPRLPGTAGIHRDGLVREYRWRAWNQLEAVSDGLHGEFRLQHDARGYLVATYREDGQTLHRSADRTGSVYRTENHDDRRYAPGGALREAGAIQYAYDADGQRVVKGPPGVGSWEYRWDSCGRLVAVTRPDRRVVRLEYDALGRRINKTTDAASTTYRWDGHELVHEGARGAGAAWVFLPKLFAPLAKEENGALYPALSDLQGAATVLVDESGRVVWNAEYDLYGATRVSAPRGFCPWRFPGQYEDEEIQLCFNWYRYYDPEAGGYISQDPLRIAASLRLYGYVRDVLTQIDPFGLEECRIFRGTDLYLEVKIFQETGLVMSDAARLAFEAARMSGRSTGQAIEAALQASRAAHEVQLRAWGSLGDYVMAHGLWGQEITAFGQRSMISFTTDPDVTGRFGRTVFSGVVDSGTVIPQTIGGSEAEVLVLHMIKL